jgi:hypothetical protein
MFFLRHHRHQVSTLFRRHAVNGGHVAGQPVALAQHLGAELGGGAIKARQRNAGHRLAVAQKAAALVARAAPIGPRGNSTSTSLKSTSTRSAWMTCTSSIGKTVFAIKPGKTRLHAQLARIGQRCVQVHVFEAVRVAHHIVGNAV